MKKAYLSFFNFASCIGWTYISALIVGGFIYGHSPSVLWTVLARPLQIVQAFAILEIIHPLLGLTRSSAVSSFLQVASRHAILWMYTTQVANAHSHWSLYLMAGSWALVEIPRYSFLLSNLHLEKAPALLFFLRYNLFVVLYPTGISGELIQVWNSLSYLKTANTGLWYFSSFVLPPLYLVAGPFLFMHMVYRRRSSYKKRFAPPKIEIGVVFPVNPETNDRSTSEAGKAVFAASIRSVDEKLANEVENEMKWRFKYVKHMIQNVKASASSSKNCLEIAKNGLEYLHNTFEFVRDGTTSTLAEAMDTYTDDSFETAVIHGELPRPEQFTVEVPYKGRVLEGEALIRQLKIWVDAGTIEQDVCDNISAVVSNHKWSDLRDLNVVMIGASSAMGPLSTLLRLGATVVAVDIDRPKVWKKIVETARNSCGTLLVPLSRKLPTGASSDDLFEAAGCNVITQTPEIRNWLLTVLPGKRLTIGNYTYLDGAEFVKISLAGDAIVQSVCEKRKKPGVFALAFLASPSDVLLKTPESLDASIENNTNAPLWQKIISSLWKRALVKNAEDVWKSSGGKEYCWNDGIVVAQGPNYALAKRIQHWRVIVARQNGYVVSENVAPSTATLSVVHNKLFAAAYGGFHRIKSMEVFEEATTRSVMAALLISDLKDTQSVAHPKVPLSNPLEVLAFNSFHGGIWRAPYKIGSIGEVAAISYFLQQGVVYLAPVVATLVGVVAYFKANDIPPPHLW